MEISFLLLSAITAIFFAFASRKFLPVISILAIWMMVQSFLAGKGFYQDHTSLPPHLLVLIAPAVLLILVLFLTKKGRDFIDQTNSRQLTYLHSVRILVEIFLYQLYLRS